MEVQLIDQLYCILYASTVEVDPLELWLNGNTIEVQ